MLVTNITGANGLPRRSLPKSLIHRQNCWPGHTSKMALHGREARPNDRRAAVLLARPLLFLKGPEIRDLPFASVASNYFFGIFLVPREVHDTPDFNSRFGRRGSKTAGKGRGLARAGARQGSVVILPSAVGGPGAGKSPALRPLYLFSKRAL